MNIDKQLVRTAHIENDPGSGRRDSTRTLQRMDVATAAPRVRWRVVSHALRTVARHACIANSALMTVHSRAARLTVYWACQAREVLRLQRRLAPRGLQ